MKTTGLTGLVAATHTPFHEDGSLNPDGIEKQAEYLLANKVTAAFIAGTTGESQSLSLQERLSLSQRWFEVVKGTAMQIIVHVGSNCLVDARSLAEDAERRGAIAISALAPSYFKPQTVDALVDCNAEIAAAAPETPFYFYDIPALTNVRFPMPDFLEQAHERIPSLAGIKFTNPDLLAYQSCLHFHKGAYEIFWGSDEALLAALAVGAQGAVGSTYNLGAPIYQRLLAAFAAGDLATAREEQWRSAQFVRILIGYGLLPAAKATMAALGVPLGPTRLPNVNLTQDKRKKLLDDLTHLGFFDWVK